MKVGLNVVCTGLLVEYCIKSSLFMIWVLLKLIWKNEQICEFWQYHCQNSDEKKKVRERKNDVMVGEREMNFSNVVAEIPVQNILVRGERTKIKEL